MRIDKWVLGEADMHFMFFLVSFLASAAGAICGIGGGVIMKPLLDAAGILSVSAVSFLSGCTVLSMAAVSVGSSIKSKKNTVRFAVTAPLSMGAALGGLAGRITFQSIRNMALAENRVGFIQAEMLLAITLITFIYTLKKDKLQTLRLQNAAICVIVGIMLGFFSAFLGIGGGPVNLMVLSYFFSMDTKEAAVNSLFVILVSQIFNLMQTILSGNVPKLDAVFFVLMIAGGILGGKAGNRIYKKIRTEYINDLFQGLMIIIMLICMYNMYRFY